MAARKRKTKAPIERLVDIEFETPHLFHEFKVLAANAPHRYGRPVPRAWEIPEDPIHFYEALPSYKGRVIPLSAQALADVRKRIERGEDPHRPYLYE